MKLRNLNGAIRKSDGAPKITIVTAGGDAVVSLVKSDLIAGLAAVWSDNTTETGLKLDESGFMVSEEGATRFHLDAPVASVPADLDLSGLLLGGPPGEIRNLVLPDIDPDQIDIDDLLLGDGPPTFDDDDLDGLLG